MAEQLQELIRFHFTVIVSTARDTLYRLATPLSALVDMLIRLIFLVSQWVWYVMHNRRFLVESLCETTSVHCVGLVCRTLRG